MLSRILLLPPTTAKDILHPWLTLFCFTITDSLYFSGFRPELNVSSTVHNRTIPSSIKYIHWPTSVNSPALFFVLHTLWSMPLLIFYPSQLPGRLYFWIDSRRSQSVTDYSPTHHTLKALATNWFYVSLTHRASKRKRQMRGSGSSGDDYETGETVTDSE